MWWRGGAARRRRRPRPLAELVGSVAPLPGIPAAVACPFCGGYVRGHQWIGSTDCSITVPQD